MEKITLILTETEAQELYNLVRESSDTGNFEWDIIMKNIEEKLYEKI